MDWSRLFTANVRGKARALVRDSFEIALPDGATLVVARVRDPRARRLRLSVDERGARLTLPLRASLVSGERFAVEHRLWLVRQLARHLPEAVSPLICGVTATLPLHGVATPVQWRDGRYTRLQRAGDADADGLVFTVSARAGDAGADNQTRRSLRDFYESQARADIARWLPGYLTGLPRAPSRIRLKSMRSQWGSLAAHGAMSLDLSLVLARPAAFEYVLVHELCHLIHADHSRAFWDEVERRCPHWHDEREYLHVEGGRLKATLRGLCGPPLNEAHGAAVTDAGRG